MEVVLSDGLVIKLLPFSSEKKLLLSCAWMAEPVVGVRGAGPPPPPHFFKKRLTERRVFSAPPPPLTYTHTHTHTHFKSLVISLVDTQNNVPPTPAADAFLQSFNFWFPFRQLMIGNGILQQWWPIHHVNILRVTRRTTSLAWETL